MSQASQIPEIACQSSLQVTRTLPQSSTVSRLPPEITDRIIDFLRDEQLSLCKCALVCRAWVPRSRVHLFEIVTIDSRRAFNSIVDATKSPRLKPFLALTSFLVLIGAECSKDEHSWTHALPLRLGRHFSSLTYLSISHFNWKRLPTNSVVVTAGFPLFSRIVELELCRCKFGTFGVFQRLVCALPNLHDLHLFRPEFSNHPSPDSPPERFAGATCGSRLKLQYLKTVQVGHAVYDWLRGVSSGTLATLHMKSIANQTECEAGQRLITTLGNGLKDLELAFINEEQVENFCRSCCLSKCTNMEILYLLLPTHLDTFNPQNYLSALLSQISPSTHLRKLNVSTRLYLDKDKINFKHLRDLSEILACAHFRNLRYLCIQLLIKFESPPEISERQVRLEVEDVLSGLLTRGVTVRSPTRLFYKDPALSDDD